MDSQQPPIFFSQLLMGGGGTLEKNPLKPKLHPRQKLNHFWCFKLEIKLSDTSCNLNVVKIDFFFSSNFLGINISWEGVGAKVLSTKRGQVSNGGVGQFFCQMNPLHKAKTHCFHLAQLIYKCKCKQHNNLLVQICFAAHKSHLL